MVKQLLMEPLWPIWLCLTAKKDHLPTGCVCVSGPPEVFLDADRLSDQDHGHATVHPLPLDEQELAHKRSDVHDLADLSILPRQDVVADAPECGLQVGHDLLTAHHQNHLAGRASVGAELTLRGGGYHQNAILRDRVDAPQHEVGAGDELADLARLGLAIHLEDARPQGVIAARILNGVEDPGVLEGLRLAGVDLRSLRQSLQHYLACLVSVVDDHHLNIALPHPHGDSLDGLFGREAREVFSQLGHIWVSSFFTQEQLFFGRTLYSIVCQGPSKRSTILKWISAMPRGTLRKSSRVGSRSRGRPMGSLRVARGPRRLMNSSSVSITASCSSMTVGTACTRRPFSNSVNGALPRRLVHQRAELKDSSSPSPQTK